MPIADPSFSWQEALAGFAVISIVAFLVTWVVTDLGRVPRTPYVAILAVTTTALAGGYIAWSGTAVADLVTADWSWGVLAGIVAAALVAPLVRRLPIGPRPRGSELAGRLLWEGVVYGTAEAILLATPFPSWRSGRRPTSSGGRAPPGGTQPREPSRSWECCS